jgi:glycosyltransferase involved in cell wall biosynthesis
MTLTYGFIIPVYRHGKSALPLARELSAYKLPIIMIDDGNDEANRAFLETAAAEIECLSLVRLPRNSGKGAACHAGFIKAKDLGLSHAFQIDADGQHDTSRVNELLEASRRFPDKLICGVPEFDKSIPKGRVIGKNIANRWAGIVTLCRRIQDGMCGFRIYPLEETMAVYERHFVEQRMGFDLDILIQLYWAGVEPVFYPVKVHYPKDGISNYHYVRDNVRIILMFIKHFFGMLPRSRELRRRDKAAE